MQKVVDHDVTICYNLDMQPKLHNFKLDRQLFKGNKMTEKLFTVAGTATNPDGTTKARFANDLVARIKILNKAGCTNITLEELPHAMTKLQALQFMQDKALTGDASYVVASKLAEKTKLAKKGEVKVAGAKLKTPTSRARAVEAAVAMVEANQ